ncbi:enoyl-CoA hydratase/isomerase family protein [Candidatus Haliotispira prima]|uniref:Enoyl-CoA hydratase/isomerase family protein n=1 Tax=Candidatus Haliotispira prima TaxID=3034016 RepID=A0ABY8MDN7_9SPIO|nr:enoyl-CoA hydratase/isomerase family protein [Candidatus Haliotispira prima]
MAGAEFHLLDLGQSRCSDASENRAGTHLGALALIVLSDPSGNGNALDTELLNCLTEQLEAWRTENIRAVILRSASDIAFSVGMDFAAFRRQAPSSAGPSSAEPPSAGKDAASLYRRCLDSIYHFPAPVFCLLEKPARAGGVGLVMAADLVLATQEASLTLGEALFGLIPANVMPYLRKRINERKANRMVSIPEALDAQTLFQWGLIDFAPLADTGELEKLLKKLLRSTLRCNPAALAKQKAFGRQIGDLPLDRQQVLAEETLARCLEDPAVETGINAFLSGGLGPWAAKPPKTLFLHS